MFDRHISYAVSTQLTLIVHCCRLKKKGLLIHFPSYKNKLGENKDYLDRKARHLSLYIPKVHNRVGKLCNSTHSTRCHKVSLSGGCQSWRDMLVILYFELLIIIINDYEKWSQSAQIFVIRWSYNNCDRPTHTLKILTQSHIHCAAAVHANWSTKCVLIHCWK